MSVLHQTAAILLYRLGITRLARTLLVRRGRFALILHGVTSRRYEGIASHQQPSLSREELRLMLAWLRRHFAFLTPTEFLETDKPGVLLTFDDGFASNATNALPVLAEFSVPAVFFISTQHIIDPRNWLGFCRTWAREYFGSEANVPPDIAADFYDGMSPEQLMHCAAHPLITIGSHTVSHPLLTQCSDAQLAEELSASRQFLREITRQQVDLFAYPKSELDERVAQAVQMAGYRAAFANDPRRLRMAAFDIPRIGVYFPNVPYLELKFSGLYRRPLRGRLL